MTEQASQHCWWSTTSDPKATAVLFIYPFTNETQESDATARGAPVLRQHASPDQHDDTRLGGGDSLGSSFGTFYMPNIFADMHDGVGGWTTAHFPIS